MKIDKILELAKEGHKNQFRKDGITPYINHPIQVCNKLKELDITEKSFEDENLSEMDYIFYAVALMHDLLEDTNVTAEEIKSVSDESIFYYVELLTCKKDDSNPFYKMEYMEKILRSNELVFLIKCADRICNVYDFIKSGDYKYAKIYFHKADILWNACYKKYREKYKKLWNEILKIDNSFRKNTKLK